VDGGKPVKLGVNGSSLGAGGWWRDVLAGLEPAGVPILGTPS